jgi:hypothetical protein
MSGQVSALGTDYDAVAAWAQRKLPALAQTTEEDSLALARAAEPKPEPPGRKLPPYLRRAGKPSSHSHALGASDKLARDGLQTFDAFEPRHFRDHLDRSNIQADPFSASGRRRAALQERKRLEMSRPLRPPPRRLYGSEDSAFYAFPHSHASAQPTKPPGPSRTSQLVRRLVTAKARADPRWRKAAEYRLGASGWSFEDGAWSFEIVAEDPILSGLLEDRLQRSGRDGETLPEAAHAQLQARLLPERLRAGGGAERGGGEQLRALAVHAAPPEWLTAAHLQLEAEAEQDDAARLRAGEPPAEELARLRRAHALEVLGEAASEAQMAAFEDEQRFSDADLFWRSRVRANRWLQRLCARALAHFDTDGDGALGFADYTAMSKALYAVLHAEYDEAEADRIAREDWLLDSQGGRRQVGQEEWVGLWLQLADLWTTGVSLREYASFLISALLQITMAQPRSTRPPPRPEAGARRAAARPVQRVALSQTVAAFPLADWRRTLDEVFRHTQRAAEHAFADAQGSTERLGARDRRADPLGSLRRASTGLLGPPPAGSPLGQPGGSCLGRGSASELSAGSGAARAARHDLRMVRSWAALDAVHSCSSRLSA